MKRHLERKKECEDKNGCGRSARDLLAGEDEAVAADDVEAWQKMSWEEKMTDFIEWFKVNGAEYLRHFKSLEEKETNGELDKVDRERLEDCRTNIMVLQECVEIADKKLEEHQVWKKKQLMVENPKSNQ